MGVPLFCVCFLSIFLAATKQLSGSIVGLQRNIKDWDTKSLLIQEVPIEYIIDIGLQHIPSTKWQ